jgi:hypothetical protein
MPQMQAIKHTQRDNRRAQQISVVNAVENFHQWFGDRLSVVSNR